MTYLAPLPVGLPLTIVGNQSVSGTLDIRFRFNGPVASVRVRFEQPGTGGSGLNYGPIQLVENDGDNSDYAGTDYLTPDVAPALDTTVTYAAARGNGYFRLVGAGIGSTGSSKFNIIVEGVSA